MGIFARIKKAWYDSIIWETIDEDFYDELEEKLKGEGLPPARVEGYRSNSWILLDWGNVVIHIFTQEGRDFYDLDHLWADGKNVEWSPSLD